MPITKTLSNRFKLELGKGAVNLSSDAHKVILMASGFVFNKDIHGTLADISASEITSNGGYAMKALITDVAWNQDNVNDLAFLDWKDVTWTAAGADYDGFCAAIVYNDTHADDIVVGCIDFGEIITLIDEAGFRLQDIGFEIAGSI
jgi:hypothetical protein